jgi:Dual specificity phosphatase, catalytic domain
MSTVSTERESKSTGLQRAGTAAAPVHRAPLLRFPPLPLVPSLSGAGASPSFASPQQTSPEPLPPPPLDSRSHPSAEGVFRTEGFLDLEVSGPRIPLRWPAQEEKAAPHAGEAGKTSGGGSDGDGDADYAVEYPDHLRGAGDPTFLRRIPLEERFAEVGPRVFLASCAAATDPCLLEEWEITHVLHVGVRKIAYPPGRCAGLMAQCAIAMQDEDVDIGAALRTTGAWIAAALASDREARVLVHCFAGSSRSPTIVAGHLVQAGVCPTARLAFARVMGRAPWIMPSGFFQRQVEGLESAAAVDFPPRAGRADPRPNSPPH